MKISSTQKTETNETQTQSKVKQTENEEQKISFSEEYQQLLAQNMLNPELMPQNEFMFIKNQNLYNNYSKSNLHTDFNYNTMTISKEDAQFFADIVEKTEYTVKENGTAQAFQLALTKTVNNSDTQTEKATEVSKALMNLIEEAYKTQKPARIDFDNNVSVILRITKDGKLSADFIPGDKAVEEYLKNNIGTLKTKLEEQNIDYGDIMYKPYKNNSKQQRNNRNGGSN